MLDERGVVRPEAHSGDRDDHSMQLTEYALAIIALAPDEVDSPSGTG